MYQSKVQVNLEDFIHEILQIRAKRKVVKTNKKEAKLLQIINHNFNKTQQTRFDELNANFK